MSNSNLLARMLLGLLACSSTAAAADDAGLRRDLQVVAGRTVFFGHQSVGENLLDGLRELSAQQRVPLRIEVRNGVSGMIRGSFGHGYLAANYEPLRKLGSFEAALPPGASPDLALMKICYVDIDGNTDVRALFARYQETLARLKARHPGTTFVHVTAPLTIIVGGARAVVSGQPAAGLWDNIKREEYNTLLRRAYQGREPIFDLARIESTAPDGGVEAAKWEGKSVPAMVPAYTDDGGHLNREGRERAARALVATLAAAPVARREPGAERP